MKKCILFLLIPFLLVSFTAKAQRHAESFEKGIVLIDLSSSIGVYKNHDFVTQRIPLFLGVDYGVHNDIGLGIFGGWNQRSFKTAKSPAYDVNYYFYGGRLSMHLAPYLRHHTMLKFNPKMVDIYATLWAGRQVAKQVSFSGNSFIDSGGVSIIGGYIGARIYTMSWLGFMVELGAGPYGLVNFGLCSKF